MKHFKKPILNFLPLTRVSKRNLITLSPALRVCPLSSIYWLVNEKLLIIEIEKDLIKW